MSESINSGERYENRSNNSLMYEVADVKAWANLGLFFAEKAERGSSTADFRVEGGEEHKQKAVQHLENALYFWDKVVDITWPIYKDMPLAAYSYPHEGNESEINNNRLFHWEKLRPEVARDVEIAKNATVNTGK